MRNVREPDMQLDDILEMLQSDTASSAAARPARVFVSYGEAGWYDDLADALHAWWRWRGDRPVVARTTVRGAPSVVELEVGAERSSPATLLWDDRTDPVELRIYVDPEDAA